MDAGVPIKAPVAGIAMGLVYAEGKYTTLTDILGAEDAFGDMDFKVAGTAEFVTALQLDTKIDGIPADVLASALRPGQGGPPRRSSRSWPTPSPSPATRSADTAPKIISFEIPIDKIGEVIGPKGKVINAIQAETGADISVDDDGTVGTVTIGSTDSGAVAEAERQIELILNPPTAEVGEVYDGQGRQHHQVRRLRQHPPGPRRPGPHLQARWRQAHRPGRGRRLPGRRHRGAGRRHRPDGKVSLTPLGEHGGGDDDGEAPAPVSPATAATVTVATRDRDRGGDRDRDRGESRDRDRDRRPSRDDADDAPGADNGDDRPVRVSFEDEFEAELEAEFGDLGPAAPASERWRS